MVHVELMVAAFTVLAMDGHQFIAGRTEFLASLTLLGTTTCSFNYNFLWALFGFTSD